MAAINLYRADSTAVMFSKVCLKVICVVLATNPFRRKFNFPYSNVSFPGLQINMVDALRVLQSKFSVPSIKVSMTLECSTNRSANTQFL
jgi:hypothetical protein